MNRPFLLFSAFFVLFFTGCVGRPEASSPPGTNAAEPTVTSAQPTVDATWPTIAPSSADFDYYLLALSWAPDYCSANPGDTQECSLGRKYAFVLHGLWPQYTTGYPSNCSTSPIPAPVKARFPHLYPNDKLFDHEWSKHGTCSGLSPSAYLTVARQFMDRVVVPPDYQAPALPFRTTADDLDKAFLQVNPTLTGTGLAVNCSGSGRFLSELYACFSKDGQPAQCGADVRKSALKSCSNTDFLVRSVR